MKVLILYNLATILKKGNEQDMVCEQEIRIILPLVVRLLESRGYEVETLEVTYSLWENLKDSKGSFDMVFNMAEAFGGTNSNEVLVPTMLEALEIPSLETLSGQLKDSGKRELSTTMSFVRTLSTLVKDKNIGERIVPIVPDGVAGVAHFSIAGSVGGLVAGWARGRCGLWAEGLSGRNRAARQPVGKRVRRLDRPARGQRHGAVGRLRDGAGLYG
mgnify:CR=1 FL=1